MDKKIKKIILTALFAALVVVGSRIYIGTHDTIRFHLGNSMCLLAAFTLGPLGGGIASGLGSFIFDLLFYSQGGFILAIVTLVTKFIMGYVTGLVYNKTNILILSGIVGEAVYIVLYVIKTYVERKVVLGMSYEAVMPIIYAKFGASVVNAIIAIIISFIVFKGMQKTFENMNLYGDND